MITISICLSDIPKDKITQSDRNGKKYLSLVVNEKQAKDNYGNTHSVAINQTKQERERGDKKIYIGSGKEYIFNNNQHTTPTVPVTQPVADDVDDLPF